MMLSDGSRWIWLGLVLLATPVTPETYLHHYDRSRAARLCVAEGTDCTSLTRAFQGFLLCTEVRDRLDCLKKMQAQEADIGYFEAEDLKVAAMFFNDSHQASLQVFTEDEVQSVYLLVHNASNPSPRSLCHPGFNLQRSYPQALYRPVTLTSNDFLPDIKTHIEALSEAWATACIPGPWSLDPATDRQLKQQHPHLCRACLRQSCHAEDPYAGSGALTCLMDHAADAAFISDVDFRKIRAKKPEVENLSHYCPGRDGKGFIRPLGDHFGQGMEPCDWGKRPLPVLMFVAPCNTSNCNSDTQSVLNKKLVTQARIVAETLSLPQNIDITLLEEPLTPSEVLSKAGYTAHQAQKQKIIRFCVHNEEELAKCRDLEMVTRALGVGIGVEIGCLLDIGGSHCFSNLYFGNADVIALDSGDVYQVTKDFGFQRVLSEVYDTKSATPTSSYYAVAVVKADSNITSFSHLQGRKSCHTGIGKTAGWKLPVATLLNLGLINPQHCNYVNAMAEFFTGGSCAPGAKDPTHNKQNSYIDRLCSLCVGDGDNKCARGSSEPFYSYTGAFRCLVHGGGDVAFVKHTTVPDNTDGNNNEDWAVSLRSEDFKLLCPSHDSTNTAAVTEFQTCNLALVPAHEVVVSGRMPEEKKREVRQVLLGASEVFSEASSGHKTFRLFGKYHGMSDLLFKDSAKGLKALSEDTPQERKRKKGYFKKLQELHSCEVHVCALEEQLSECETMVSTMSKVGQQFVCVSARDRLDCVRRVMRGQVDVTILPGSYLNINPNLRVIAYSKDPVYVRERYRYKAVMVVRRSTIHRMLDLRGRKSCHTGYGRTTGWRIPIALLKREGIIHPLCDPHMSTVDHEIRSVATTFNRACIPGEWATSPEADAALKMQYDSMCSMCKSRTCDKNDEYAGYVGALRCLTFNEGDVAFSKLTVVQEFFMDNAALNVSDYGLMCRDGKIVDINSAAAQECFWAARPWDTFVTHGGASDSKVQKMFWALTEAKRKGEEDLENNLWYFNTLGIDDVFSDILPVMDNTTTGEYLAETRMDIVSAEEMCSSEASVRFCVTSNEEHKKCEDLAFVLKLKGISPQLECMVKSNVNECLEMIQLNAADVITLDETKRSTYNRHYSLADLLTETYEGGDINRYYFIGVIKKGSGINSVYDLVGKTTCNTGHNSNTSSTIDEPMSNCLSSDRDFFLTFTDAFHCLMGSNKDVAFVKHSKGADGENWDIDAGRLYADNFELLCETHVMPVRSYNVQECNLGRIIGNMVVTRKTESGARKENIRHIFLKASSYFGKSSSFFRLFYNYFSRKNLMFRDNTVRLSRVTDTHHLVFVRDMLMYACDLYGHHVQSAKDLEL